MTTAALDSPPAYAAAMRLPSVDAGSRSKASTSYVRSTSESAGRPTVSGAHNTMRAPSSSRSSVCALA